MQTYFGNFSKTYLLLQLFGWLLYVLFALLLTRISGASYSIQLFAALLIVYFLGLIISHLYRALIIRFKWLEMNIIPSILRLLFASLVLGFLFEWFYFSLNELFFSEVNRGRSNLGIQEAFGWVAVFFLWSVIYFAFHYFKNYKQQEIKNLQLEASKVETELRNLKSQLNPHFIFNALNSARALVNENPDKARTLLLQLSGVLRKSLSTGNMNFIPFKEELELVNNYLNVEKVRYEERLEVHFDIDSKSLELPFPPFVLQTLCENAIKHGISKLKSGGEIIVKSYFQNVDWVIEVRNTGKITETNPDSTLIGLENTKRRLYLLYDQAVDFSLRQLAQNEVVARIIIDNYSSL